MVTTVLLTGVVSGLLITLALYYPMYTYVPSLFAPEFAGKIPVRIEFVWTSIILATVLFLITGAVSARLGRFPTKWGGMKAGGISGFVAATMAFGMIVSPTAGILGNAQILLHGLKPVENDATLVIYTADAVADTMLLNLIAMLIMIFSGLLFGGLGGVFIKTKGNPTDDRQDMVVIAPVVLAFSFFVYLLSYLSVYLLIDIMLNMPGRIKESFGVDYQFSYDPQTIFFAVMAVTYLWILLWQVNIWLDLRAVQKGQTIQRLSWAIVSMFALIIPILALLLSWFLMFSLEFFVSQFVFVVLGIITFWDTFWRRRKMKVPPIRNPFSQKQRKSYLKAFLNLAIILSLTLVISTLTYALDLVLITVAAIGYIRPDASSSMNTADLFNSLYRYNFSAHAGVWLAIPILLFFIVSTFNNFYQFSAKYGEDVTKQLSSIFESIRRLRRARKSR